LTVGATERRQLQINIPVFGVVLSRVFFRARWVETDVADVLAAVLVEDRLASIIAQDLRRGVITKWS
jgi:hypothetical protein